LRAERFVDLPDFLAAFFVVLPAFLAVFLRERAAFLRVPGPSPSSDLDFVDEGVEEVLSIGSGSIHPEPDQPISK